MAARSSASDLGGRVPTGVEVAVIRKTGPGRRVPSRSCVACRTVRPKRELLRVVRTPDGRIEIDESGRQAGRGAYLCRDGDCQTTAIERGALTRALGSPLPAELRSVLAEGMTTNEGGKRGKE
jgi:predicted RNA-binding protein YlxR (DUF448 family)